MDGLEMVADSAAAALQRLTPEILAKHMQVTEQNPMSGLEGRTALLSKLGGALAARPDIVKSGRPGDLVGEQLPLSQAQADHSLL